MREIIFRLFYKLSYKIFETTFLHSVSVIISVSKSFIFLRLISMIEGSFLSFKIQLYVSINPPL